jgi:hypothetical protein
MPFFQNGVALPLLIQRLARLGLVGINGLLSLSTTGTNIFFLLSEFVRHREIGNESL